jgi:hypothetical protein
LPKLSCREHAQYWARKEPHAKVYYVCIGALLACRFTFRLTIILYQTSRFVILTLREISKSIQIGKGTFFLYLATRFFSFSAKSATHFARHRNALMIGRRSLERLKKGIIEHFHRELPFRGHERGANAQKWAK